MAGKEDLRGVPQERMTDISVIPDTGSCDGGCGTSACGSPIGIFSSFTDPAAVQAGDDGLYVLTLQLDILNARDTGQG